MIRLFQYHSLFQISHKASRILLLFLLFLPKLCSPQIISTIAGTGTGGYNGDGIPATTAQLNIPHGVAVDVFGNIYIAEELNYRIRKIDISTGIISTVAGTGTAGYNGDGIPATTAQVNSALGLAFNASGDLIIADRYNNRIRKVDKTTGIISTIAGTGTAGYNGDGITATAAQLYNPIAVAFDANDNLLIADWVNNRLRKVDKVSGLISTIAGNGTAGYNGDGIAATTAQINTPFGIVFDNTGNIYFAEYFGQRIRKITISTGLISTIGGTGTGGYNGDGIAATTAQLSIPSFLAIDGGGNIYIGDAGNNRVRKIDAVTGFISTIAGTGTGGYNGDGIPATTAQVNNPFGVCFDKNCNLLIGDRTNSRVRKITGGFTACLRDVAPGNKISCQALPAVTVDNSNNNSWVGVYDSVGNIAAEINANGNNLGVVNTSLYTKTGACREDINFRLYLNRNLTITPQNQPASGNINVRLYLLRSELDSLRTAMNSQNQPSGVVTINEVDVFNNNDTCLTLGGNTALPLSALPTSYKADYYLQVSISSLSSFHFANKALPAILPVKIKSFTGKHTGMEHELRWEVVCNADVSFAIERSADGIHFNTIGFVSATAADCSTSFYFTDKHILAGTNYYRLHIVEQNRLAKNSDVLLLNSKNPFNIVLLNNLVTGDELNMYLFGESSHPIKLICTDLSGRSILSKNVNLFAGNSQQVLNTRKLVKGIYWIYAVANEGRSNVAKFIIQ